MKLTSKSIGLFLASILALGNASTSSIRGVDRHLQEGDIEAPTTHVVSLTSSCNKEDFDAALEQSGGSLVFFHEDMAIAVVKGLEDEEAVSSLSDSPCVDIIHEDESFTSDEQDPVDGGEVTSDMHSPDDPSSAFLFGFQWNLVAIGADKAWAAGRLGSEDIKVAVLDSGIDYTNPDLNGLVDLDKSASFVPSDDLWTA